MNPQRLLWLFIPLALIGGASLGLYFAWLELAAAPVNATPAELRRSEKELYIRLVASAYAEEQDVRQILERAREEEVTERLRNRLIALLTA